MQQWHAPPPNQQNWMPQQQQGYFQPPGGRRPRGRGRGGGRGNGRIPFQQVTFMQHGADQGGGGQRNVQPFQYPGNPLGGFQRQRAQPQQQQYQQRQPQQQRQYQGNNQGGNAQQQVQYGNARPLPTNYLYCWTHGYAVSSQHNSMSCMNVAPGHQTNAGGHRLNF